MFFSNPKAPNKIADNIIINTVKIPRSVISNFVVVRVFNYLIPLLTGSIKAGFRKGVDQDGVKWARNANWYISMKGNNKPNIGSNYTRVYNRWFVPKNRIHMKDAIITNTSFGGGNILGVLEITYRPEVINRARLTQYGGVGVLVAKKYNTNKRTVSTRRMKVNIVPRPHIYFAIDYKRYGGRTDIGHINWAFKRAIGDELVRVSKR